jgi:hypothetical protein
VRAQLGSGTLNMLQRPAGKTRSGPTDHELNAVDRVALAESMGLGPDGGLEPPIMVQTILSQLAVLGLIGLIHRILDRDERR